MYITERNEVHDYGVVLNSISTCIFNLQTRISSSKWPSEGYGPKVLEKYKFSYQNWTFNYKEYVEYLMTENLTDESRYHMELMQAYLDSNYVKVR